MAQGRMLSKRVTKSEKVAALSSDTARMIYSWLIPYTDVEGRMESNPRLLKGEIAPLLDHITPESISEILRELADCGLIIIYGDQNQYLQIVKFEENQPNLRKDREKKSDIPPPDKCRSNSGPMPEKVRYNIREDNIREANTTPADDRTVDNSQDKPLLEFRALLEKTKEKYPDPYDQQKILVFIQANLRNKNHKAIIHCIESLIKAPEKVKAIPAYLEAALKIENGKYNAAEEEEKNNKLKTESVPGNIKALLAGIGGPQ